jgi:hypothetical protein
MKVTRIDGFSGTFRLETVGKYLLLVGPKPAISTAGSAPVARAIANRAIQAADVVRVMIEIRKEIDNEAARSKALNLSPEEIAFYDAVAANVASLFDEKTLCDLIRDVVQTVKKNLKVDWTKPHREDVKAGVRAAVKNVLRRRGVKKEQLEALADKVLMQAEVLFREWPMAISSTIVLEYDLPHDHTAAPYFVG